MIKKFSKYAFLTGALVLSLVSCEKDVPPDPVTDVDKNIYRTVRIGTQVWMAENLRTTHFNDGTEIPLVANQAEWDTLSTPGYCWYNNDESSHKEPYGALYNAYTVGSDLLCPTGWHIPEKEEWQLLVVFLGDSIKAGGKLKEAGTDHWLTPNKEADNSSGFGAVPAGIRYFEGSYSSISYFTSFWSSTHIGINDKWYLSLYYGDAIARVDHKSKSYGFSVRCIKDKI